MKSRFLVPNREMSMTKAGARISAYLLPLEVNELENVARESGYNKERNALFVATLFQCALRISEALSLTPRSLGNFKGQSILYIKGKGNKERMISCPESLFHRLKSYAYDQGLGQDQRFFSFNRQRGWQIIKSLVKKSSINKRVWPHLLRHSGSLERLRQSRNPRSLQLYLGHASSGTTLIYLSKISEEDALAIESQANFE